MVQDLKKIILIRGLSRSAIHWGDFSKRLTHQAPDIKIEFLDIPGNGTLFQEWTPSEPIEAISQMRLKSEFIVKNNKIHLCGISLGGMLALKWAELLPEEVQSVCVINSSLRQLSPFYHRLRLNSYLKIIQLLIRNDWDYREEKILEMSSNQSKTNTPILKQFQKFAQAHPIKLQNFIQQLMLAKNVSLHNPVKCPVKIFYSNQDRLVNPQCSIELSKFLNCSPSFHPTAGHDLPLDAADWLSKNYLDFLLHIHDKRN